MAHRGYSPHGSPGDDVEPDHFFPGPGARAENSAGRVQHARRWRNGDTALHAGAPRGALQLGALYTITSQPLNREAFRDYARTFEALSKYAGARMGAAASRKHNVKPTAAAHKGGMVDFEITEWTPRLQVVRAARHEVYYPSSTSSL